MQRQGFWRLYAWLVSLHRPARKPKSAQGSMAGTSASPILTFVAAALFSILAILEIDLHRDELRVVGLIFGEESIVSPFVGP